MTDAANGTKANERIYLGRFEVYREYDATGATVTLERDTLHVMDDKRRIALVETLTIDPSAPANSTAAPTIRYQFDNHLESACLKLDQTASIISYEEYYPYGSTSYQAGLNAAEVSLKRYRYVGKERDEENGFSYLGARYYAPWLGRWTATDPLLLADGPNAYVYAQNSPARLTDTNGMQASDPDTTPATPCPSSNCHTGANQTNAENGSIVPHATNDELRQLALEANDRDSRTRENERLTLTKIEKADASDFAHQGGNVCQSGCHALRQIRGAVGNTEQMNKDAILFTKFALAPLALLGGTEAIAAKGVVEGLVLPTLRAELAGKAGYGTAKALGADEGVSRAAGF